MSIPRTVRAAVIVLGLASFAVARPAAAQIEGLETWARSVAEGLTPTWRGPLVELPGPNARPKGEYVLHSPLRPLAVHASRSVPVNTAENALDALEEAYDQLGARGWPTPYPDGGRGGTAGFDLYLLGPAEWIEWERPRAAGELIDFALPREATGAHREQQTHPVAAAPDARVAWSYWDGASAFGVIEAVALDDRVGPCVTSAYAEAALLGIDPAEALEWRRATADALAFITTGRYGCTDAVDAQQGEPHRSWVEGGVGDGSGGALFLSLLSERRDGGTGDFLLYLWQFARQRSYELGLRGLPDLWHTLHRAEELAKGDLDQLMEMVAVDRYFVGHRGGSPRLAATGPPSSAAVPLEARATWKELPLHTKPVDPPLGPYGSAYVLVDLAGRPAGSYLRVWVQGELGVGWGLTAVLLDEDGGELRRVSTPPQRKAGAYAAVELVGNPGYVLLVATNLGSDRLPDAREPKPDLKSFRWIVDLVEANGRGEVRQ